MNQSLQSQTEEWVYKGGHSQINDLPGGGHRWGLLFSLPCGWERTRESGHVSMSIMRQQQQHLFTATVEICSWPMTAPDRLVSMKEFQHQNKIRYWRRCPWECSRTGWDYFGWLLWFSTGWLPGLNGGHRQNSLHTTAAAAQTEGRSQSNDRQSAASVELNGWKWVPGHWSLELATVWSPAVAEPINNELMVGFEEISQVTLTTTEKPRLMLCHQTEAAVAADHTNDVTQTTEVSCNSLCTAMIMMHCLSFDWRIHVDSYK